MFRTTLAVAAVSLLSLPAAANHGHGFSHGHGHGPRHSGGNLLQYTGQIRSQMALVQAQADATFERSRSSRLVSRDVYRELDDLCRELDRLEELTARPLVSRGDFRRLERSVERVDAESRDVEAAVRSALDDPRRFGGPAFLPATQSVYYPGITTNPAASRGIRLVFGGGRVGVNIGGAQPTPHLVARPVAFGRHGHGDPAGDALCAATDNLRLMTRQLVALVSR